eukprot:553366_1
MSHPNGNCSDADCFCHEISSNNESTSATFTAYSQFNSSELHNGYDTFNSDSSCSASDMNTSNENDSNYDSNYDSNLSEFEEDDSDSQYDNSNEDDDMKDDDQTEFWHSDRFETWNNQPQQIKYKNVVYGKNKKWKNITENQTADCLVGCLNPIQAFWLIFVDSGSVSYVADCTNKRLKKKKRKHRTIKKYKRWKLIEKCILCICILLKAEMGFTRKPNIKEYWDTNGRGLEVIRGNIQRCVFLLIWSCLCFYDCEIKVTSYSKADRIDNGFKCRLLWQIWNKVSKKWWKLSGWVCLDEYMIDSLCKWISNEKIKAKKHSTGIKVYLLCDDSGWCAFVELVEMECKHFKDITHKLFPDERYTVGSRVLLYFVKEYKLHNHAVVGDSHFINYFANLKIYEMAAFPGGTCRKNAVMMPYDKLKYKNGKILKNGDWNVMVNKENALVAFAARSGRNGTKIFSMQSLWPINHLSQTRVINNRAKRKKNNTNEPKYINKNIINSLYIQHMHSVDKHNQVALNGSCNTKARGWTKHGGQGYFDFLWAQCLILWNYTTGKKYGIQLTKRQFIKICVDQGIDAISRLYIRNHTKLKNQALKTKRYQPNEIKCIKKVLISFKKNKAKTKSNSKARKKSRNRRGRPRQKKQKRKKKKASPSRSRSRNSNILIATSRSSRRKARRPIRSRRPRDAAGAMRSESDAEYHEPEEKDDELEDESVLFGITPGGR